ncbi:MAG TPA: DUF418 domain-containing protein, partial [Chloroflexota bacterium]|nr:DUF418 domain-containing protein [Chloroflexota bacterium]
TTPLVARPVDSGAAVGVAAAPVQRAERIDVIDVIRGFALFGILLVNMGAFSEPIYQIMIDAERWPSPVDQAVEWLIRFLAEGKFYSLFSFLFGLGLTLQMSRAEARGVDFVPLYVRRLLVLLAFGLIHAYLIWVGDILTWYAIFGFVLLLFRKCSPRTLLTWAAIFLLIPVLLQTLAVGALALGRATPEGAAEIERSMAETERTYRQLMEQALTVYREGSFAEITAQRARDLGVLYGTFIFVIPNVLAMFLCGLYAGHRGIFRDIPGHLPFIRRVLVWGLIIGLIGNFVFAMSMEAADRAIPTVLGLLGWIGQSIGAPALCFFYAAALTLLFQQERWRRRLTPLASVGRMALSNYLLQSLVCTTIFYGYGLGLFGQVSPAWGLVLTVVIYVVQIPLSVWWLRHFQFGPAEWLWRSLTYLRWQPMRVASRA